MMMSLSLLGTVVVVVAAVIAVRMWTLKPPHQNGNLSIASMLGASVSLDEAISQP